MAQTAQLTQRQYVPCSGYQSSAPRDRCRQNAITSESTDWRVDPLTQDLVVRQGSTVEGSESGLLEATTALRARQILEYINTNLSDGYPTHLTLWGEDANSLANDTPRGLLHYRNTNTSVETVFGKDTSRSGGTMLMPALVSLSRDATNDPQAYITTDSAAKRAKVARGSRRVLQVGDSVVMPNFLGTPAWAQSGLGRPDSSGLLTNERCFPLGHTGCPAPPTVTAGDIADTEESSTWDGDATFYVAMAFRDSKGGWSQPTACRAPNSENPYGVGLVKTLGTSGLKYRNVVVSNIWIGPNDTTARAVFRTITFKNALPLDASDLRLWFIIENNTQTSITITEGGRDEDLEEVPTIVRDDYVWPPAARYSWASDHRLFFLYCQRNPAAIIVAPIFDKNGAAINTADTTFDANRGVFYRNASTEIRLTLNNGSNYNQIACSGKTIQQVVDAINATRPVAGSNTGQWAAAVAPGADPYAPATSLFDAGDGVFQYANNIAYPGILYMASSYTNGFPIHRSQLWFTMGDPGMPPMEINNWSAKNERHLADYYGEGMGGAALIDGSVVFFRKAIAVMRNIRGGRTGLDDDYHLDPFIEGLGCIAWNTVVNGNGWAGCMTEKGFLVTDGRRHAIISIDMFTPGAPVGERGEWETAINNAVAASAKDGDPYMSAKVEAGRLYVCYNPTAATYPTRFVEYNFSPGLGGEGLEEVLKSMSITEGGYASPDATYPWSAPQLIAASVVGSVAKSDGRRILGLRESVAPDGSGFWGEVLRLENGRFDVYKRQSISCTKNGTTTLITSASFSTVPVGAAITGTGIPGGTTVLNKISDTQLTMSAAATDSLTSTLTFKGTEVEPLCYFGTDFCGTDQFKSLIDARILYRSGSAGTALTCSRDQDRSTQDSSALPQTSDSSGLWTRQRVTFDLDMSAAAEALEFGLTDSGAGTNVPRIKALMANIEILDTPA